MYDSMDFSHTRIKKSEFLADTPIRHKACRKRCIESLSLAFAFRARIIPLDHEDTRPLSHSNIQFHFETSMLAPVHTCRYVLLANLLLLFLFIPQEKILFVKSVINLLDFESDKLKIDSVYNVQIHIYLQMNK